MTRTERHGDEPGRGRIRLARVESALILAAQILAPAWLLAGCSAELPANESAAPPPAVENALAVERPSAALPLNKTEADVGAEAILAPGGGHQPYGDVRWRDDSFSGGQATTIIYHNGSSADVFTLADDRVWRVRANFGTHGRCRDATSEEISSFVRLVAPAATADQVTSATASLQAALAGDSLEPVRLTGVRIAASRNCVTALNATAE